VVFRTIGILLRFLRFFTFFLKIQKVVTFNVFFAVFHTFSRTMIAPMATANFANLFVYVYREG